MEVGVYNLVPAEVLVGFDVLLLRLVKGHGGYVVIIVGVAVVGVHGIVAFLSTAESICGGRTIVVRVVVKVIIPTLVVEILVTTVISSKISNGWDRIPVVVRPANCLVKKMEQQPKWDTTSANILQRGSRIRWAYKLKLLLLLLDDGFPAL